MKVEWMLIDGEALPGGMYLGVNREFDEEGAFSLMPVEDDGTFDDPNYTHVLASEGEPIESADMEWQSIDSVPSLPDGTFVGGNHDGSDFGAVVVSGGEVDPDYYTHVFCSEGKPVRIPKAPKHVEEDDDEDFDGSDDDGWEN